MRTFSVLVVLAILGGCGGNDVSPLLAKLCDDPDGVWAAYQSKIAMCAPGVAGEQVHAWGRVASHAEIVAACRGNLEPYLKGGVMAVGDDAALAACRAYLDATPCADFDPSEARPCRAVLVGLTGGGSYCERDEECTGDGYCADAHGTSCGGCRTRQVDGVQCDRDVACVSGYCAGGVCATPGDLGAACHSTYGCKGQLVCVAGTCAAPPAWAVGTACFADDIYQCTSSDGSLTCGTSDTCVQAAASAPGTAAEGAACTTTAACGPLLDCYDAKCQYAAYSGKCPGY